jgi:hypothetical protein
VNENAEAVYPFAGFRSLRGRVVVYTTLPALLASGMVEWKATVEPWQFDAFKTYFGYDSAAPL